MSDRRHERYRTAMQMIRHGDEVVKSWLYAIDMGLANSRSDEDLIAAKEMLARINRVAAIISESVAYEERNR